jgi:hypothetical protein
LEFSETVVDKFQYVILVIFFTVANILIWKLPLTILRFVRSHKGHFKGSDLQSITLQYRPVDVVGLTVIAIVTGLAGAYAQNKDVVLHTASAFVDWRRTSTDDPFQWLFAHITEQRMNVIDKRDPKLVEAARGSAFIRVYINDTKIGYEGYPGLTPGKLDRRQVILTPACRFSWQPETGEISNMQVIPGPGVYLELSDVQAIEIIDMSASECNKKLLSS